jgi:hypothetical protein
VEGHTVRANPLNLATNYSARTIEQLRCLTEPHPQDSPQMMRLCPGEQNMLGSFVSRIIKKTPHRCEVRLRGQAAFFWGKHRPTLCAPSPPVKPACAVS